MKSALALLLACLTLVAVACGGDDDDDGGGGGTGADTPEQAAPAGGGGTEVRMKDIEFDPAKLTIKPGETVEWVNDDSVGHDVTADDFKSGEPGAMAQGDTFEHTFEKPGTYDYVCSVHPGMEGTVTVK